MGLIGHVEIAACRVYRDSNGFERTVRGLAASGAVALVFLFLARYREFRGDLTKELACFAETVHDAMLDIGDIHVTLVRSTGAVDGNPRQRKAGGRDERKRTLRRFRTGDLHFGIAAIFMDLVDDSNRSSTKKGGFKDVLRGDIDIAATWATGIVGSDTHRRFIWATRCIGTGKASFEHRLQMSRG